MYNMMNFNSITIAHLSGFELILHAIDK